MLLLKLQAELEAVRQPLKDEPQLTGVYDANCNVSDPSFVSQFYG